MTNEPRFVHKDILMEIIGNHPHAGDRGHPVSKNSNSVHEVIGMYEIEFENGMCQHGTTGCFAKKQNLKMLKRPQR